MPITNIGPRSHRVSTRETIVPLNEKTDEQLKQEREAAAAFTAGAIIAGRSALEKAAHEEYNDPVAFSKRLAAEFAGVDARAETVLEFLHEGEPDRVDPDVESPVLQKVVKTKMAEDAGEGGDVKPEPRADGLDVVKEQVAAGKPVENPNLDAAPAVAGGKKDEKDDANARKSESAPTRINAGAKKA